MKKILIFLFLVFLLIISINAQDKTTLTDLVNTVQVSENLRSEFLSTLPDQQPWETDKEYQEKIYNEYRENTECQKIMAKFFFENYQLTKKKYSIDTSNAAIKPNAFDRESKKWVFNINTNSLIFPNDLKVSYYLLVDDNVSEKYSEIITLIDQQNFSLTIDLGICHMTCYNIFSFLKSFNIDIEEAIEDNIFLVVEDIIAHPTKYGEDYYYATYMENYGSEVLASYFGLEWLNDGYTLFLSNITLFNGNALNETYPNKGRLYFYLSDPSKVYPVYTGK